MFTNIFMLSFVGLTECLGNFAEARGWMSAMTCKNFLL